MVDLTVQRHNETVLDQLEKGDIVQYDRGRYSHYAVYAGKSKVIHLTGLNDDGSVVSNRMHVFTISGVNFDKAKVCKEDFFKASKGLKAYKNNYMDKYYSDPAHVREPPDPRLCVAVGAYYLATLCKYHTIANHIGVGTNSFCEGEVVHLAGLPDDEHVGSNSTQMFSISGVSYNKARVCVESFFKVAQGSRAFKNNYKDKDHSTFSPPEIVKRAKSKIGRVSYNVLWSNCEHFATWCRYNVGTSEQTENFLTRAAVVGTLGAVAAVGLAWWYGGEKTSESEQTRDKKGRKERK